MLRRRLKPCGHSKAKRTQGAPIALPVQPLLSSNNVGNIGVIGNAKWLFSFSAF
jgi:hypothetical protein